MPRFFDDYSNTYLTHDSSAGRKQQRRGWKFRENFRLHYETFVPEWRKGPMGLASAQQAFIQARGVDDPAVPPLPHGWREAADDVTGIIYYIDTTTKKRTWVRPGFIPPPPGAGPPPPRGGGGGGPPPPSQSSQFHGPGFRPGPGGGPPPPPPPPPPLQMIPPGMGPGNPHFPPPTHSFPHGGSVGMTIPPQQHRQTQPMMGGGFPGAPMAPGLPPPPGPPPAGY